MNWGAVDRELCLADMPSGQKGTIKEIRGGTGMMRKLDALGIRPGKEIVKVSAQWMRGPVLLRNGATEVAVGFGMARHIIVELPEQGGSLEDSSHR
jgi:ferrous iron transport protein A